MATSTEEAQLPVARLVDDIEVDPMSPLCADATAIASAAGQPAAIDSASLRNDVDVDWTLKAKQLSAAFLDSPMRGRVLPAFLNYIAEKAEPSCALVAMVAYLAALFETLANEPSAEWKHHKDGTMTIVPIYCGETAKKLDPAAFSYIAFQAKFQIGHTTPAFNVRFHKKLPRATEAIESLGCSAQAPAISGGRFDQHRPFCLACARGAVVEWMRGHQGSHDTALAVLHISGFTRVYDGPHVALGDRRNLRPLQDLTRVGSGGLVVDAWTTDMAEMV
ncbi:hypothetical protein ACQY0O_004537 [Thecaphora frezii]